MTLVWCNVDQVTVCLSHDERLGGIYGFRLESRAMRSLSFTAVLLSSWTLCCVSELLTFRDSGLVPYSRNQVSFFLGVLALIDGNDVLFRKVGSAINIEAAQHPNW